MSRRNRHDNLNPVQLFPFVAVLLCTMGSLLVLLVGVARSSRDQALEQLAAKKAAEAAAKAAATPVDEKLRQELDEIETFIAQLDILRVEAERQLQNDQRRLSHLEDHMRRLHDQLGLLKIADAELNSKEGAHYDDREQAERELERLEQLIAESHAGIEELRKETGSKQRSVAILPGPNARGTRRPPIYVECRGTGVYLQPEGIRFTRQDFLGPPGPSSPLAAALRAAREHLVSQNPADAGDEAEPYALVVVRPDGVLYFQMVCEVIHQAGMDFGYELIDADWKLQYPTPNPRLAAIEGQAVAIARNHLQMMVSAAPRMYGADRPWTGEFDDENEAAAPMGSDRAPPAGRFAGGSAEDAPETDDGSIPQMEDATPTNPHTAGTTPGTERKDELTGERKERPDYITGDILQQQRPQLPPPDEEEGESDDAHLPRGEDWAIKRMPGTVPIRRTIQVVVRDDRLAILPDSDDAPGREIEMHGTTQAAIQPFVAQLKEHIAEWGIAGRGLSWRPVLELKVGPDGQRRADDLVRLLRRSGIEVKFSSVAQQPPGESAGANR